MRKYIEKYLKKNKIWTESEDGTYLVNKRDKQIAIIGWTEDIKFGTIGVVDVTENKLIKNVFQFSTFSDSVIALRRFQRIYNSRILYKVYCLTGRKKKENYNNTTIKFI